MLPKHCDAKFSKLSFAKYQVAKSFHKWIDSFELVSLCCISGSSFVGSTKSLLKDDGSTGTITHCKRAKHQLDSVNLQEDSKNWIKSCPKLIQDDSSSWTITLGPDWYLRHVRLATVDGQNIQTPSIRYSPLTPKVQCYCNLKCVSPSGRKNTHTPNITFANTRAETLRFGGAGVQHSAWCRVWIFCPSTVSLSDVFTSFGLQTLLGKHQCACCWSQSKLRKTLAFHK